MKRVGQEYHDLTPLARGLPPGWQVMAIWTVFEDQWFEFFAYEVRIGFDLFVIDRDGKSEDMPPGWMATCLSVFDPRIRVTAPNGASGIINDTR